MTIVAHNGNILRLQALIQELPGPFLLRKYEAVAADFEELAEEDLRCEFLDGELIVHSPASFRHEELVSFTIHLLRSFVEPRDLGWILGSNTIVQLDEKRLCPDVSFLKQAHGERVRQERIVGPADLVIEVVSPSTRDYDLGQKRRAYQDGHVPEIWLIDLAQQRFYADCLGKGRSKRTAAYNRVELTTGRWLSRTLAGLSIQVDWFWSKPLPPVSSCLQSMEQT